jgi:hypothetical protein
MRTYRPRSGPNLPTIQKLQALAEYRELHRDKWGRPPTWTSACQALHMNYRTVRRHLPQLLENWYNKEVHW